VMVAEEASSISCLPKHIGAWSAGTPTDLTPLLTMNEAVSADRPNPVYLWSDSKQAGAPSLLHGGRAGY
jgi:hypothetical protein